MEKENTFVIYFTDLDFGLLLHHYKVVMFHGCDGEDASALYLVKVRVNISYNNLGSIIWHYLQDLACSALSRYNCYHHYINATEDATVLRQPVFSM